jgi:AcrR family transcriptional regulator
MSAAVAHAAKLGLRERKKLKTREAIQREAMRLFQTHGYEETTIEQIADAAEISPSTFFNYFPSKEDLVLYDRYDPMLVGKMLERPADEPLSVSLRHVLNLMESVFARDHDVILARAKLGLQVPALRAKMWEEMEKAQALLCGLVAQRTGRDPNDFELRVVVRVVLVAALEAMFEWVNSDGRGSFLGLVNKALDVLDAGARLDAMASAPRRG